MEAKYESKKQLKHKFCIYTFFCKEYDINCEDFCKCGGTHNQALKIKACFFAMKVDMANNDSNSHS